MSNVVFQVEYYCGQLLLESRSKDIALNEKVTEGQSSWDAKTTRLSISWKLLLDCVKIC